MIILCIKDDVEYIGKLVDDNIDNDLDYIYLTKVFRLSWY